MISFQNCVREFHRAFHFPIGLTPALRDVRTRAMLIAEESVELLIALVGRDEAKWLVQKAFDKVKGSAAGSIYDIAKECADVHYVVSGTSVQFGIDEEPIFLLVHESNMSKVGGGMDETGKWQKGPNYRAPDVAAEMMRQGYLP